MADMKKLALEMRKAIQLFVQSLNPDTQFDKILSISTVYPKHEIGVEYKKNNIVSYGVNENGNPKLYLVLKDHTSSEDNLPDTSTDYYKAIEITDSTLMNAKLVELSNACNEAINNGASIELSDGSVKSFTYTIADQANVSEMFTAIVMGATEYPYHANNEECCMYSAKDIITIYSTLSSIKTAQITYHNQLKRYVKTLTSAEDIESVVYGQELTGEYLETFNTLMAQATAQMQAILSKVAQNEAIS